MSAVAERSIRIVVAQDGANVHLVTSGVDPRSITADQITAALRQEHIAIDEIVTARIKAIEQAARAGKPLQTQILLVEAQPPEEGQDARFELAEELAPRPTDLSEDDQADFHRTNIVTVRPDTPIGTFTAAVPSKPGTDVLGKPIQPQSVPRVIKLGSNLRLAEDGKTVVAKCAGKVHITNYQVDVVSVVEIPGDVDFSSGNVETPTNVLVNGTIRDTFEVRSAGSITVRGAIEAATIDAGTDLQVNGGIASHGHGQVHAKGEIFTKFCNEAQLEANGDITISREALNSSVRTFGRLLIDRGKLIGGSAYARCGAEINQLGNPANVKTEIAIGIDPLALIEAAQSDGIIRKKQEAIAKIRQNVQPLMAQLKRLTPAQRERATELLYQADSMELEIAEQQKRKAAALQQGTGDGREVTLVVNKIAYPNVTFIFGNKITTLHKERKGPFKVVRRVHNRVEEILLIDKLSGSITVLGSREYEPQAPSN